MAAAGSARRAGATPRPEQARSVERRAQLLDAALRLLVDGGSAAVTHRGVAKEANSSPGAVRYHFQTREDLLAACVDEIERARAAEAAGIIDSLGHDGPLDEVGVAWLILRAYHGPTVDDATVTGTFWSIVDCGRESPRLAQLLGTHRQVAIRQLEEILAACGYRGLQPTLAAAVLDGGILTAVVEGQSPVTASAASDLAAILRLVGA